jgi:hypothetical protein
MKDSQKKLWGPTGWYTLHALAYQYQPKLYHDYHRLFTQLLGPALPCPKCQKHYQEYLPQHPFPPVTSPKSQIIQWVLDYHNQVSSYSPETQSQYTQEELKALYYPTNSLVIPINHRYIWNYLKIMKLYHKLNKSLNHYRVFVKTLAKIFPCEKCQKRFAQSQKKPVPYLRIIANHGNPSSVKQQKIKIRNTLSMN